MREELLINFLVKGVKEDEQGRQEFPSDSDSSG
jgi:hypothetical protein